MRKMRKISIAALALACITSLNSCKKEGCTDSTATNFDSKAKKNNGTCIYINPTYTVPTTYSFDRNGSSSISFSGQTQRMNMLTEKVTYLKTANTPGTSIDATKLKDMYANTNSQFSDVTLNTATKQLKNKTAGGDATIQAIFEDYMNSVATISASTTSGKYEGRNGTAGVVQSGSKQYLFNAKGKEYTQLIEKGLMGAVFYNQITTSYLGDSKMNVDNSTIVDGKNYTKMEHHWDEAFGYFTDSTAFPIGGKVFWAKYCDKRDTELGTNKSIMDAFIKGRAAITNKDLTTRNAQIVIIRNELEKVTIATAAYYLNKAKLNITDDCLRNHELSEAITFIEAIKYGFGPSFTSTEVDQMINQIGNNFYEVKSTDLAEVIAKLDSKI